MITSRHNPLAQRARAARDGKLGDLIFVEGVRLCEEAARARLPVEDVIFTAAAAGGERGRSLLARLARAGARLSEVSQGVIEFLADTKTPQGLIALARRPDADRASLERALPPDPLLVVMHRINNPANAGAMLRVAEAAGASGVVATAGSADLFSPKALRGAMGSSFRLPVWAGAGLGEALRWCAELGVQTISADVRAGAAHTDLDWTGPRAVVMGSEGAGLTAGERAATDLQMRIPMRPPVESLNVAVALAVVLYEAARQRSKS